MTCEWCGKFVVMVGTEAGSPKMFEIMRDDENRLLQAYDGNLIYAGEHLCKARCSSCAARVILEEGRVFEHPSDMKDLSVRMLHKCAK